MASLVYNKFVERLLKGEINLSSVTVKAMLVNGYTPNKDTHEDRADVTDESSGDGYTAGGATSAVTLSRDNGADTNTITLGAVSWNPASVTADGCVYYVSRGGSAGDDEIIAYNDFGGDLTSTNASFSVAASTITLDNSGA